MPSAKDLAKAINSQHIDDVQKLVKLGAPLEKNFNDIHGNYKPLARASCGGNLAMVEALLDLGADINGAPAEPWLKNALTASFWDKTKRYTSIAEFLIEKGADVNHLSYSQDGKAVSSTLMHACDSAHIHVVKKLIDHGAEIDARVVFGTALTTAIESNRVDVVEALLDFGAQIDLPYPPDGGNKDLRNLMPVEIAKKLRKKKIIALLENKR